MIELGILKNFDSGTYKAGVQLAGSLTTYFDDISVAKNIPSAAMVVGNYVIVASPGGNPRDACVIATWPQGSPGGGAFLDLSDTPSSYVGQAGKVVKVNSDGDALEFEKITGANLSQDFGVGSGRLLRFDATPMSGNAIVILDASEDSPFSAKINAGGSGGLTSTNVPYDNESGEGMFEGLAAYDGSAIWGQIVLHNTTRGNSRKIVNVDIANKKIATSASTDDWADNDDITVDSQTAAGGSLCDLDLSTKIPPTAYAILVLLFVFDKTSTYNADRELELHPYEAYDSGKKRLGYFTQAGQKMSMTFTILVIDQKICFRIRGAVDFYFLIKVHGYWEYADT
jgi:hypothetical protein